MSLTFDEKVAAIRGWYAAYNARDIRGLCAVAHESIEIVPMQPLLEPLMGTAFHGHAGIRTLMQWTFENFPRIYADDVTSYDTRGATLAQTTFIYDVERPAKRRRVWSLFHVKDAGIRQIHAFATEAEANAASRKGTVLTPREREVFALLAQGLTATQIAEELHLSPLTVRTHIQNAKDRLGARTRMQALSIALERGELHL